MENFSDRYRLSLYSEVVELTKGKIYIVKSSLDDKIYIKKVLESNNQQVYKKIQSLSISNIPKIYEIINLDDKLVIIEEYINGNSLKQILSKSKTITEDKVIKYSLDLINILMKLHSSVPSIIHKDIKPSNIIISNDDILKLIDFDISRIHKKDKSTDTNILGSYGYASPEQFGFNQTDSRTDIFSLGVTMNMMLTGSLPIEEAYKGDLGEIISKCTELDPNKRFQNINELKRKLLKYNKKYNKRNKEFLSSKLPGFKSGILFFKIIAFIWYWILFMALIGLFSIEPISNDRIKDIILVLFFFLLTLLYGNFNDLRSKFPILKSKNIIIRVLGYILYTVFITVITGIIMPN